MAARRSRVTTPGHRPDRNEIPRMKTLQSSSPAASVLLKQNAMRAAVAKLLFSIDYGTKTLSVAYRVAKPGEDPSPSNVRDVHFSQRDYFAPQQAAFDENGKFYWGYEVDKALKKKLIKPEDVIELWKLVLYKDHESSPMARRIKKQLGRRSVGDLISTHLRALADAAKEYIKLTVETGFEFSTDEIDAMPMQVFISVPQMWKAPANRIMTEAAKKAGVEYVELVYEPQCAAAYYTHNIRDKIPKQLTAGDVLLIADIGGGTGDFVSYEFQTHSDAGAKVGLRSIGAAEGALCGSEFVNQQFLDWLQKEAAKEVGSFDGMCEVLGLTPTACLKQASIQFEAIKQEFSVPEADPCYVTIRGAQGAKRDSWDKQVTSGNIMDCFKPVIEEIFRCIDTQMTLRTKTLIIPGGFGRSEYLLDSLKARYSDQINILGQASGPVGAYQPVSRGALLRYKDIQTRGLPSSESFGIGTVETWDPNVHRDATVYPGDLLPNGRRSRATRPNHLVEDDPYDESIKVVYERWVPIMKKGDIKTPGKTFTTEAWQQYCVKPDEEELSIQVYSTEADMAEHDPILNGANIVTGTVKPGIEPWGEPLVKKLPDLKAMGFDLKEGDVYEIYYLLILTCEGANVRVSWQIALPGTQPYDEKGNACPSANVELTADEVYELVDAAYNPIPRTSPT